MVGSDLMLYICRPSSYIANIDEIQYWEHVDLICPCFT
jgi:hypothetical protein